MEAARNQNLTNTGAILIDPEPHQNSSLFPKLQTYLSFCQDSQPPFTFRIPETLLKSASMSSPVFLSLSASGTRSLVSNQYCLNSAVEAFLKATLELQIHDSISRPSSYRTPAYILHTGFESKLAFDPASARRLLDTHQEYVLQRFVVSSEFRAKKMRIGWNEDRRLDVQLATQRTSMPFKCPCGTARAERNEIMPMRRHSLAITKSTSTVAPRRGSQKSVSDFPIDFAPTVDPSEMLYFVSFRNQEQSTIAEVGLPEEMPQVGLILRYFSDLHKDKTHTLSSLQFDMVQGWDKEWIFLNLKSVKIAPVPGVSQGKNGIHHMIPGPPSFGQRSIHEFQEFLSATRPSIPSAPYVNLKDVQSKNIELYLRLHQSNS